MKAKKSDSKAKGKVKIKNLKLHKETVQNLSDSDAENVRGGMKTQIGGTCICPAIG